MADRIELFHVTTPAGTLETSPLTTDLQFLDGVVTDIQMVIPDGPSGLMGVAFLYGGQQIIPNGDMFIVSNNERIDWPITGYPTGSQWQLSTYNTDIYDHTVEVRLLVNEFTLPTPLATEVPLPTLETGELVVES